MVKRNYLAEAQRDVREGRLSADEQERNREMKAQGAQTRTDTDTHGPARTGICGDASDRKADTDLRITRVKGVPDGNVTIEWETEQGGVTLEHKMVCGEAARPEFYSALDALAETAVRLCCMGWPNCGPSGVHVMGVGFKYGDEWQGVTITAFWEVAGKRKVILNTPFVTDQDHGLTSDEWDRLYRVELEAARYLDGERAQQTLPGSE